MVPIMPIPTGNSTLRLLSKVVVIGANISAVIMQFLLSAKCVKIWQMRHKPLNVRVGREHGNHVPFVIMTVSICIFPYVAVGVSCLGDSLPEKPYKLFNTKIPHICSSVNHKITQAQKKGADPPYTPNSVLSR